MGRFDDALASYENGARQGSGVRAVAPEQRMYLRARRDYASAESRFRTLGESTETGARARSRFFLACIPIYQGRFKEAVKRLDVGLELDEQEGSSGTRT